MSDGGSERVCKRASKGMDCEGEEERWVCVVKERKRGGCVL